MMERFFTNLEKCQSRSYSSCGLKFSIYGDLFRQSDYASSFSFFYKAFSSLFWFTSYFPLIDSAGASALPFLGPTFHSLNVTFLVIVSEDSAET